MFKTFGNKVKIKTSEDTEKINVAGKFGKIFGQTVPSLSGVEVIGNPKRDYAINVYFEDIDDSYWFDESLIETVDTGIGSDIIIGDQKFIKNETGEWLPSTQRQSHNPKNKQKKG